MAAHTAEQYVPALRAFRWGHRKLRGVFLIHDDGGSHVAGDTADYLARGGGWWGPRSAGAHASWLNQAELLNNAFDGRYLKRGRGPAVRNTSSTWPPPGGSSTGTMAARSSGPGRTRR